MRKKNKERMWCRVRRANVGGGLETVVMWWGKRRRRRRLPVATAPPTGR